MLCRRGRHRTTRLRSTRQRQWFHHVVPASAGSIPDCLSRIDQGQDFRRQTAAALADRLIFGPPFAPCPWRWTRTIVPSTMTYSRSGSVDNALKMFSKAPRLTQRRKRLNTEFQLPNETGRSRQGAPVRAIHKTASTKSRPSAPVWPGSLSLPRQYGSIAAHCASVRMVRSNVETPLQFQTLN